MGAAHHPLEDRDAGARLERQRAHPRVAGVEVDGVGGRGQGVLSCGSTRGSRCAARSTSRCRRTSRCTGVRRATRPPASRSARRASSSPRSGTRAVRAARRAARPRSRRGRRRRRARRRRSRCRSPRGRDGGVQYHGSGSSLLRRRWGAAHGRDGGLGAGMRDFSAVWPGLLPCRRPNRSPTRNGIAPLRRELSVRHVSRPSDPAPRPGPLASGGGADRPRPPRRPAPARAGRGQPRLGHPRAVVPRRALGAVGRDGGVRPRGCRRGGARAASDAVVRAADRRGVAGRRGAGRARSADLAPGDLDTVALVPTGSEAVDTALKLVRLFHYAGGDRRRRVVIAREYSAHGSTYAGLSLSDPDRGLLRGIGPGLRQIRFAPTPYRYRCAYCAGAGGVHARVRRGARRRDRRGGPGPRGRGVRRAGPGAGRGAGAARRVLAARARPVRPLRRAARGGRGRHRLRTDGAVVRVGPLGARSRSDDPRQGPHRRVSVARGGGDAPPDRRAPRGAAGAARLHLQRPPGRVRRRARVPADRRRGRPRRPRRAPRDGASPRGCAASSRRVRWSARSEGSGS